MLIGRGRGDTKKEENFKAEITAEIRSRIDYRKMDNKG
jgi:hypothetical protein